MSATLVYAFETAAREGCAFVMLRNSKGFALIDEEDLALVDEGWLWYRMNDYAGGRKAGTSVTTVRMHRLIMGALPGSQLDHWNQDKLDNRKQNLRPADETLNNANKPKRALHRGRACSSRFKGVKWFGRSRKWQAAGSSGGVTFHLGYFLHERDAAVAYNNFAKEHFGQFAYLNAV